MTASGYCLGVCRVGTGRYVRGAEVVAARKLADLDLATLEDCGSLRRFGRSDGERWWMEVTDLGKIVRDAKEAT